MKEKNAVSFRDYKPSDFEEVMNLWKLTGMGGEERGDDNDVIMRTIKYGGRLILMIKNGKIAGTFWLTHDYRRTFLHHFGIHPDFQGLGLAKKLMDKCMEIIKETGYQVKLEVHKENIKAVGIYKKYGFIDFDDYKLMMLRDV